MSRVRRARQRPTEERYSLADIYSQIGFGGMGPMRPVTTWGDARTEPAPNSFEGYVQSAYQANGIVHAVISARLRLFTEARFAWRNWVDGNPTPLYTSASLLPLERPWANGTTADLLAHMEQDASLAGNAFFVRRGPYIKRLRPDWVEIAIGSPSGDPFDIDAEVIGYLYQPGGPRSDSRPVTLLPETVAHFAPIPDPLARFRGMSWLSPVVEEIRSDTAATVHKGKFFDNAATPNLAVVMPMSDRQQFLDAVQAMDTTHKGARNAYKTMWLMNGADVKTVGADLKQLDFKDTQGAGETRIAAAAGVPPIIVGLSEGLAAATYSNYGQARRAFADLWARPQWRAAAACLESIMDRPAANAELWYREDGISFLQEDQKDAAEILNRDAMTARTLVDAGFAPESVVAAVNAGDLGLLEHTGLYSVQLQAPGSDQAPPA